MMKQKKSILAVMTAVVLTLGMHTAVFAAEPAMPEGSITVNGAGVVAVKPDTATVHLNVEHNVKTAVEAQQKVNADVTKITAALEKQGAAKADILTSQVSVRPSYQYEDNGNRTLLGYRAYTSIDVTTKDIDHTGKFIDAGLQAGATGTNGVTFSLENMAPHYNKALKQAVQVAQSSAQAIASAYGKTLGNVVAVVENSQNIGVFESEAYADRAVAEGANKAPMSGGDSTQVSYEDITVAANISVIYAF